MYTVIKVCIATINCLVLTAGASEPWSTGGANKLGPTKTGGGYHQRFIIMLNTPFTMQFDVPVKKTTQ